MHEEGYIAGFDIEEASPRDILTITLKYGDKKARTIRGLKRISKPGLRIYAGKDEIASRSWWSWYCCYFYEQRRYG